MREYQKIAFLLSAAIVLLVVRGTIAPVMLLAALPPFCIASLMYFAKPKEQVHLGPETYSSKLLRPVPIWLTWACIATLSFLLIEGLYYPDLVHTLAENDVLSINIMQSFMNEHGWFGAFFPLAFGFGYFIAVFAVGIFPLLIGRAILCIPYVESRIRF